LTELDSVGVGYKADLKGRTLTLRTTFTPRAGTPVVAVKKLRIR